MRRVGVLLQLGFHAGTVALVGIPYANADLAASGLLFLRRDVPRALRLPPPPEGSGRTPQRPGLARITRKAFWAASAGTRTALWLKAPAPR